MAPDVRILATNPDLVGENPLWCPTDRQIYWTDNRAFSVYRMDPSGGPVERVVSDYAAYGFTFQDDGSLLLFGASCRISELRDGQVTTLIDGIPGEPPEARFNDVITDAEGRVYAGTAPAPDHTGALYLINTDGSVDTLVEGMGMPNGMGFTPDGSGFYVADTRLAAVDRYDRDPSTGALSNRQAFLDLSGVEEHPDGLTVDAEGHVWVALVGGWAIGRFDPSGNEVARIPLNARKPTSVIFGGDDYDTMFITSSSRQPVPGEEIGPAGGALFAVEPGVRGVPEHRSNVRIS